MRSNFEHLYSSRQELHRDWTPVHRISKQFTVDRRTSISKVSRTQFPIRNAIGSTFHHSQGLTIRDGALDFSKFPLAGKHYVGLSRFTNLDSFFILDLAENEIRVSEEVKEEMRRLRNTRRLQLEILPLVNSFPENLTILQHNTRSLHAHMEDVRADTNFENADIIFLSETWALDSDSNALYSINNFLSYRADYPSPTTQRHQGIAFMYQEKVVGFDVEDKIILAGMQLLRVSVCLPDASWLQIVGFYRAPDFPLQTLLVHLNDVLAQSATPCIQHRRFQCRSVKSD